MTYILKNKDVEIKVDAPLENYNFSRFDWTGKIVEVKFLNHNFSTAENLQSKNKDSLGKGFYNEFGIDNALGFEETKIGGWFHKIGVGLLKKESENYQFHKNYKIQPAEFKINSKSNDSLSLSCKSSCVNGYAYVLRKIIEVQENGFSIKYHLQNKGEKNISTNEYIHNFIAINNDKIGVNYNLKFSFELKPKLFGENVNPEFKVSIGRNAMNFNGSPEEQFFFSNLSGSERVKSEWEIVNHERKIGIRETGSFQTRKVNVWGWGHVISPELFIDIFIKPGESAQWTRKYQLFKIL